ncbi:MAG: hypothetical protein DI535_14200 [Citrobacter freundii]|nr:MAG: hypothetical protein DI535_14200 [Citrobacter freundii]
MAEFKKSNSAKSYHCQNLSHGKLVGRKAEQERLQTAMSSSSAERVAIYCHDGGAAAELSYALKDAMKSTVALAVPSTSVTAFDQLKRFLEPIIAKQRSVFFIFLYFAAKHC